MSESEPKIEKKWNKKLKVIREYGVSLFIAIMVALTIRHFVIEPFKIPSGSMIPTLLVGDFIFVNKFKYGFQVPFVTKRFIKFKDPKRGEVVVFIYPQDKSKDFIKRVVGIAGDKIEHKNGQFYINGSPVKSSPDGVFRFNESSTGALKTGKLYEETLGENEHVVMYTDPFINSEYEYDSLPAVVPKDHIFVMGDNRDNSLDSRKWGFVPLDNLKGEALFIWFSVDKYYDKFYNIVRWKRLFKAIR